MNWFRCQLEPGYVARFIDYGNTEKKKKYEFYNLPEDLRNSSPAALKIKLKNTDSTVKDLEEALFDVKIELMIDSEGVGTFYKDGIELFKRERGVKVCSCLVTAIFIFYLLNHFFNIFFYHYFSFSTRSGLPKMGLLADLSSYNLVHLQTTNKNWKIVYLSKGEG